MLRTGLPARPRVWFLGVIVVVAAATAALWPARQTAPPAARQRPPSALPSLLPLGPRLPIDDGGMGTALHYARPVRDPLSLEHIRHCYDRIGYRGMRLLDEALNRDLLSAEEQVGRGITLAQLCLYEGEFTKAADVLARTRALAVSQPQRFRGVLLTLVFLQGVTALRLGETQNCVECGCQGSCIFPLEPRAYHQKPEGSRAAIGFFTEYLEHQPDDLGVRWLLNLATMTVGEYPDRVPRSYLIPPSAFRSEFDIGRFRDVAPEAGIDQLNRGGAAVLDDFNNDGLLDLMVSSFDPALPLAFYRNKGDGTFEEHTRPAGLAGQLGGLYCVQTDYDNDGQLDLYVCRGGWVGTPQRHSLLRNNGDGTFTDVTRKAGLLTPVAGQVACWADYDNDGWLDLFLGSEQGRCRLYHSRRDGTFEEVALAAGVACDGVVCKGACWGDVDGDGYPELYVANISGPPHLFRNNRDGTFTDATESLGIRHGPTVGYACWFFDYDNDGRLDLFAASYAGGLANVVAGYLGRPAGCETSRLYHNEGRRGFTDVTAEAGLDRALMPMGGNFADLDNDGFLDLYLGTGDPNYSSVVPNRLFRNVGGRRFADITTSSGTGHLQKGHAVACGDWDRDGNTDLFVQVGGATPGDRFRNVLFHNPGQGHHWLTVKLAGKKTNRAAIGARIKVTPAGEASRAIYRHVGSGGSYGGNALEQTIGLGRAAKVAVLEVSWPTSSTTQVFRDVPADQAIAITEFEDAYHSLPHPPVRVPTPRGANRPTH